MSHPRNTEYIETMKQNFEQAITEGNWELAQTICNDLRGDGYTAHAIVLECELIKIKGIEEIQI